MRYHLTGSPQNCQASRNGERLRNCDTPGTKGAMVPSSRLFCVSEMSPPRQLLEHERKEKCVTSKMIFSTRERGICGAPGDRLPLASVPQSAFSHRLGPTASAPPLVGRPAPDRTPSVVVAGSPAPAPSPHGP